MISGIQYVTDMSGKRIAVQIDLQRHGSLWEDFYDVLIAQERKNEPHSSWEDVKKRLAEEKFHK